MSRPLCLRHGGPALATIGHVSTTPHVRFGKIWHFSDFQLCQPTQLLESPEPQPWPRTCQGPVGQGWPAQRAPAGGFWQPGRPCPLGVEMPEHQATKPFPSSPWRVLYSRMTQSKPDVFLNRKGPRPNCPQPAWGHRPWAWHGPEHGGRRRHHRLPLCSQP